MIKIYSIIVSYNGSFWIEKCLNSLINSTVKNEIIVIDNNSSDNTVEIIEANFPKINLIKSKKNLGFGQANNIGMRKALDENADYVFLLNQDAWVEKDTIKGLIEIHKQNNDFGILSPFHLNGARNDLDKAFYSYMTKSVHGFNLISDLYLNKVYKLYETSYVNAAAWLLPIECLKITGGFDPIFFHYGEDVNYTQRIIFNGLKIGICPHLNVFHDREERAKVAEDFFYLRRNGVSKAWFSYSEKFKDVLPANWDEKKRNFVF